MNDPHVERLHYRLVHDASVTYVDCEPVDYETDAFSLHLADNELTVEMREHHATAKEARVTVEPFLRAWELDVILKGRRDLAFDFVDADLIDRDPPLPGTPQIVHASLVEIETFMDAVLEHVTSTTYPPPPTDFAVSPDVETLWQRYEGYLDRREPVASMAYFCLTVVEWIGGNDRGGAAKKLGVGRNLLDKVAEVSTRGRKHKPDEEPLSADEEAWLDKAVKLLIRRVGEVVADPSAAAAQITLDDHPPPRS